MDGVHLEAAEVADEEGREERVGADQRLREEVPAVEPALEDEEQAEEEARQGEDDRQLLVDVTALLGAALVEICAEVVDEVGERQRRIDLDLANDDRGVVVHLLLRRVADPDALALVDARAGDEAIEPRSRGERLHRRPHVEVEEADLPCGARVPLRDLLRSAWQKHGFIHPGEAPRTPN
jgi:hypothetical protein